MLCLTIEWVKGALPSVSTHHFFDFLFVRFAVA